VQIQQKLADIRAILLKAGKPLSQGQIAELALERMLEYFWRTNI
jgi:hypothetical protein